MDSYKDYYMNPGFQPQKVTIARLREILDAHNIGYTGREKKAGLIRIFNTNIRPLIPSLRKNEAEFVQDSEMKNKPPRKNIVSSSKTNSHSVRLLNNDKEESTDVASTSIREDLINSLLSQNRWTFIYSVIITMLIILIGSLIKFYIPMSVCDSGEFSNTSVNSERVPRTTCIPCPPHAHCSKDKIISCDDGFVLVSSSIHWLKPFTSRCILDLSLAQRVEKYTKLLKNIVAEETGKLECGSSLQENLSFQNLLIPLRNNELDTDNDFEIITRLVLKSLKSDDDVEVIHEKGFGYKTNVYIISKNPRRSFVCKLKTSIYFYRIWIQEHYILPIATIIKLIIELSMFCLFFLVEWCPIICLLFLISLLRWSHLIFLALLVRWGVNKIYLYIIKIKKTEMTLLSIHDEDYLSIANFFHKGLPSCTILGILKLKMPNEVIKAHETYKNQNSELQTHMMFHGTRSLCDPQRFIVNPRDKFCKQGCGVCGITQEGNKTKYASRYNTNRCHMWFANSSYTSYYYCNRYNSITSAMFVVDVVTKYGDSIVIINSDAATIPKYLIIFR